MKIAMILFKYAVPIDDPCCYPLGYMYISSVLKQAGHDVTVYNYNLIDGDPLFIEFTDYDVVMMTGFEEFLPSIKRVAAECRIHGVKTILGGALATFKPDEMLKFVDTVIVGEGESVVCTALNSNGIVQGTKPNLDNLPLPDYVGFGIEEYHKRHSYRYMGVLTSRGCPYSCKFCAQTCSFQYRKLSHVFEEIDIYKHRYGLQVVVFNDNTLNLNKARFMAICDGMAKRRLLWTAAIRCDNFDEEMAIAAKKSGCVYFVVGVESFNQKRLDAMNKQLKADDVYKCLSLLQRYDINYHGNALMGLPDDTKETILEELERIPPWFNVYPCFIQPFIGTELGYGSKLNSAERKTFSLLFKDIINRNGKYMYPELDNAA